MMTLKFKDKTEIVLTDEKGLKVQQALIGGAEFITIDKEMYSRSSIDKVVEGGELPKPPSWADEARQMIDGGQRCVGKYSIQREVNNRIREDNPNDWARLVQDKAHREQVRQEVLAEVPEGWCDYKAGKCNCF